MSRIAIRRALVSVYDKSGLEELARGLHEAGVEIVSTGSTAARIRELGIPVTAVDEVTGFPEILGGRVKTLHPARARRPARRPGRRRPRAASPSWASRRSSCSCRTSTRLPRRSRSGAAPAEVSSRSTSAARRWCAPREEPRRVAVVIDPARYAACSRRCAPAASTWRARQRLARSRRSGTPPPTTSPWRPGSAMSSRPTTGGRHASGFPGWIAASYERRRCCATARTRTSGRRSTSRRGRGRLAPGRAAARQGDELQQLRRRRRRLARRATTSTEPCVAIIKHANPCGIAVGIDIAEAHRRRTRATRSAHTAG